MNYHENMVAGTNLVHLDHALIRDKDRLWIEKEVRKVVRSVRFELQESENAFKILGPEMLYHAADPHLQEILFNSWGGMPVSKIFQFKENAELFDLCFEDTWSGYFISHQLRSLDRDDDLILIHLDDHTDMMPTLLVNSENLLIDITNGGKFDPTIPDDWESVVQSGCVSIGNFITPIYYSGHNVHVRHLNNFNASTYRKYNVVCDACSYDLIPNMQFATIRKRTSDWHLSSGTYLGGDDVDKVLSQLPEGRIIVHIDLDYFINDFNGNIDTPCSLPNPELEACARVKIELFFSAIMALSQKIERWIIATSPGFCSAYHWEWLLAEIEQNIARK